VFTLRTGGRSAVERHRGNYILVMASQTQTQTQAQAQAQAQQQAIINQSAVFRELMMHPNLSLEQKIDTLKKLRVENKITEERFQTLVAAIGKFHQSAQSIRQAAQRPAPTPTPSVVGTKRKSPVEDTSDGPALSADPSPYPMSTNVQPPRSDPQPWPTNYSQRPTLSGGLASGLVTGAPSIISRGQEDVTVLLSGDLRHGPKKNPQAEHQMRRTIQDLVASIDPSVKIVPEVEDLLLEIADEFVDSVANFSCRLAKHRGGDTLEARDLQLHLERNHNIRIPGFASDETRLSINQSTVVPQNPPTAAGKKGAAGTHMTLRSSRLNAVNQAKRDNKLM